MAKLMSKKTKETISTISVIVVVVLFIGFYIVYPLIKIDDIVSRADSEIFEDDEYLPDNDPAYFIEKGLSPDSFRVVTDDNINLACLYFKPDSSLFDSIQGTIMLIPDADTNRTAVADYIEPLLSRGYAVVVYDQRASGFTTGIIHSSGKYEGDDLNSILSNLRLHDRLYQPVAAIGFKLGADAAIHAARSDDRIDRVIAVEPYLTPTKWIQARMEKYGAWPIPLATIVHYWWYTKTSGHIIERTGLDEIEPAETETILIGNNDLIILEEYQRLVEISEGRVMATIFAPESTTLLELIMKSMPTKPML